VSDLLAGEPPLTPRAFLITQRYITDPVALEALTAAVDARMAI
jgi:hypothetical protein